MRTDHVTFDALYVQTKGLSPRAARFALQLISQGREIPYQLSTLRIALIDSSRQEAEPNVSEWAALEDPAATSDPQLRLDVTSARDFAGACRRFLDDQRGPSPNTAP